MKKSFIKDMLRESLFSKIKEANKEGGEEDTEKEGGDGQFSELNQDEKKKVQTLTKKIKNATQGAGKLLKLSQVMDAAGVGSADNATDRSAIGKAVSGKPDADGKVRHLSVKQANSMGKVVDNPVAFK
jgi:hypothetical protein